MIMDVLFALSVGIFFGIGVFQMLRRDLIKAAMGYSILFTGVNLFLLAVGAFDGEAPPYTEFAQEMTVADPLVQALILTAIVIGFGSYAMLLAIINVITERFGTLNSDDVSELEG